MSIGTLSPVRISDYEDVHGRTLSNNSGPKCGQCGKPMDIWGKGISPEVRCQCGPGRTEPDGTPVLQPIAERQAQSLEIIAAMSIKQSKILERVAELIERFLEPATVQAAPGAIDSLEIPAAMIAIPDVTPPMPAIDPERLKANEDKKTKLIAEMKGGK